MTSIDRERYAELFGPTTGDRIRLADTDLLIEVTEDRSMGAGSGDEVLFRRRQGDPRVDGPGHGRRAPRARLTWSSPAPSCSTTGAWSRPTSACATAGSSASARRATRTPWTASIRPW
ncbi:hypothetical protein [Amycolatopsis methanolica]|uniref:hypothetical protein n=1 Tax=Amycolatopsis methanolica TaxID=1814 RepID=UPI003443323A